MITVIRTTSDHSDFRNLIQLLDTELKARYQEIQDVYDQFNKIENNDTVVIAYMGNEAVGCACIKPVNDHVAELKRMYVKPAHRGKGVAQLVLQELENWALQLSYSAIILETGIRQQEAVALYRKSGFLTTENYPPYVEMPESICMRKTLR